MIRKSIPRLLVVASLLAAVSAGAQNTGSSSPAPIDNARTRESVWCLDEKLSIVKRTVRWRCEGRVVSDAEAQRVKQARVDRIKRVLQREREPLLPGKRLRGTGTGFFVSSDGQVVTNNHVIAKCAAVTVSPAGGTEVIATVRSRDPQRDLALLQTAQASPGSAVFRGFDEVIANEPVTIVGYPLHGKVVIKPVVISGHVYAESQPKNPNVFSVKADIRRGNSGGPVLDQAGRVMGVVFAKIDTPQVYEKTGKLVRDVGLAIRLPAVMGFLRRHSVDITITTDNTPLEFNTQTIRAQSLIAQIRCWR